MVGSNSAVFSYALSSGNTSFAWNKGIDTWMLKLYRAGHLLLFSKFSECGLIQTTSLCIFLSFLKFWESEMFERLGVKVIQFWNTKEKNTWAIGYDYDLFL